LFKILILSAKECEWGTMLDKLVVEPLVPKLRSSEVHITLRGEKNQGIKTAGTLARHNQDKILKSLSRET
jgi:hypothetical protein